MALADKKVDIAQEEKIRIEECQVTVFPKARICVTPSALQAGFRARANNQKTRTEAGRMMVTVGKVLQISPKL